MTCPPIRPIGQNQRRPKGRGAAIVPSVAPTQIAATAAGAAVAAKPVPLTLRSVACMVDTPFDRPAGIPPRKTRPAVTGQAGLDRAAIEKALSA